MPAFRAVSREAGGRARRIATASEDKGRAILRQKGDISVLHRGAAGRIITAHLPLGVRTALVVLSLAAAIGARGPQP